MQPGDLKDLKWRELEWSQAIENMMEVSCKAWGLISFAVVVQVAVVWRLNKK